MKKNILGTTIFVLLSSTVLYAGADAGVEQEVRSGDQVKLSGAESTLERDGRFVRFKWRQRSGKRVRLLNRRSVKPSFIAPDVEEATVLKFSLTTKERFRNRRNRKRIFRSRDFVDVIVLPKETVTPTPEEPVKPNPEVQEIFLDTKVSLENDPTDYKQFKFTINERTRIQAIATAKLDDSFIHVGLPGIRPSTVTHSGTKVAAATRLFEPGTYTIAVSILDGSPIDTLELIKVDAEENKEIFLNTTTHFKYRDTILDLFKFTINETTRIKIITSDTSSDDPGLILREGDSTTGKIIAIDPLDGGSERKVIEITLEPGTFTIEPFSSGGRDCTLELLSV